MRQSKLFTKTRKEAPADEVAKNAELLIRAGFIHKEMAGVYSYLPLGLKVLNNIEGIIRSEMNILGASELHLSTLQNKELWEKTDRWDDAKVDNWFKTNIKNGGETGLGITHEEPLTAIMSEYISSYRDLPTYAYQFQNKFRNEARAKSGIMRGREFLMKDLYSFSKDEDEHKSFYEKVANSYINIFNKCGLGDVTYRTYASGGIFSKFSDEFQTLSDAGEDTIYIDESKKVAVNKEVYNDEVLNSLGLDKNSLTEKKSIEVGNIFSLGTKFSEPLELNFKNDKGEKSPVIMGSYGIGLGRLMGTIVEVLSDDKGIVWPEAVSPFKAHLVCVTDDEAILSLTEDMYRELDNKILYDDRRDVRAGEKFADADLIGIPYQIIIGKKSSEDAVEVKNRKTGAVEIKSITEIIDWLKS